MIESKLKAKNCNPANQLSTKQNKKKQLSTGAILGLQFGLHHVVATLSFLRSISLTSLFAIP